MIRLPWWILVLACVIVPTITHAARDPMIITDEHHTLSLGRHIRILEDSSGKLGIEQVLSALSLGQFEPSTKDVPSFGYSASSYWAHTRLTRQTRKDVSWLLELGYAPTQWVDVYVRHEDGRIGWQSGGSQIPFEQRPYAYQTHVFPLDINEGETVDLFVKISGESSKTFPLTLYREDTFQQHSLKQMLVLGSYFGILFALMIYNLFIYYTVREKSYLYYVFFLASSAFFFLCLTGLGQELIWSEWPIRFIPMSIGIGWFMAIHFTAAFIDFSRIPAVFYRLINFGRLWGIVSILLPVILPYRIAIINSTLLVLVGAVILFSAAIIAMLRGNVAARYYLFAWALVLIGILVYALRSFAVIPTNLFTTYAVYVGSALESIVLSVALAARMRVLRMENEATQRQLMEKEKMANLGLLSASIAHEINNPNNFLSLSLGNARHQVDSLSQWLVSLLDGEEADEIRTQLATRIHKVQEHLTLAEEGSQRIASIVKSMRSSSRNDREEKQAFDPVEALLGTVELVKANYRDRIAFDTTATSQRARIMGHASQMNQVFTNLLVNACHAIDEKHRQVSDSPSGHISLESRVEGNEILITLRDNGCGMSEEVQRRLFEPFFTTKGADHGTGLGMGICRGIIAQHNGRLEVLSMVGAGTTMTLILPVIE